MMKPMSRRAMLMQSAAILSTGAVVACTIAPPSTSNSTTTTTTTTPNVATLVASFAAGVAAFATAAGSQPQSVIPTIALATINADAAEVQQDANTIQAAYNAATNPANSTLSDLLTAGEDILPLISAIPGVGTAADAAAAILAAIGTAIGVAGATSAGLTRSGHPRYVPKTIYTPTQAIAQIAQYTKKS